MGLGINLFENLYNYSETFIIGSYFAYINSQIWNSNILVSFSCSLFLNIFSPGILRWDCLATDWYHAPVYPTFLFFNPHLTAKTFEMRLGSKASDLYNAVTHQFVKRNVRDTTILTLSTDSAAVIVITPPNGKITHDGGRTLVDNIVVDWQR